MSASAEVASLAEAMAVSGDRSLRAATAGDAQAAAAQDAVANAYAGALADALAAQRRAHRAFARGLRAAGIDIPQAAAVVRVLNAQGALPGPLAATLLADLERLRVAGASARDAAADRLAADARRARGRHGIVPRLVITPLVALEGGSPATAATR